MIQIERSSIIRWAVLLLAITLVFGTGARIFDHAPSSPRPQWAIAPELAANSPVTAAMSHRGSDHCGWKDIEFLELTLKQGERAQYIRDVSGKLSPTLTGAYQTVAGRPDTAVDTGWRDGPHRGLWLSPQQEVAIVSRSGNWELWPRTPYTIGCD
jgi:hypothetical protein